MKKIVLFLGLTVLTWSAAAASRSIEEMRTIAAKQLHRSMSATTARRMSAAAQSPRLLRITDAYAVFAPADNESFVIISRDESRRPVLGYAATPFPTTDMPDGLQWYLQQVELTANSQQSSRRNAATYTATENFVTTTWDQGHPFNLLTPNKYPSGCVATSIAQCMNYCQWPESAEFEGTCRVTKIVNHREKSERQTLDISSTYTWPYKDNYSNRGRTQDNIAELLRDCGYATYMNYSDDGSGTASYLAGIALTHIFNYPDACIRYRPRDYCTSQDEWAQIIYDELMAKRPVYYGASDESFGGHAFLLSGIDEDGLVYVNWGWRGTADGFFDLADLNPKQGSREMHFNNGADIVFGFKPIAEADDKPEVLIYAYSGKPYTFRWGTATDDDEVEHHTLYCELPYGFLNVQPADFNGVFGLFADDLTDGSSWVIAPELRDPEEIPSGYGYCGDEEQWADFAFYYYIDGEAGLTPGHTYRMSFGSYDPREGRWHSIMSDYGEVAYEITYTGDPATSTVSEDYTTPPVLTGIYSVKADGNNHIDAFSAVTRVYDQTGRLVHTAPTAHFNLWNVTTRGILIVDDGRTRRKVVR